MRKFAVAFLTMLSLSCMAQDRPMSAAPNGVAVHKPSVMVYDTVGEVLPGISPREVPMEGDRLCYPLNSCNTIEYRTIYEYRVLVTGLNDRKIEIAQVKSFTKPTVGQRVRAKIQVSYWVSDID